MVEELERGFYEIFDEDDPRYFKRFVFQIAVYVTMAFILGAVSSRDQRQKWLRNFATNLKNWYRQAELPGARLVESMMDLVDTFIARAQERERTNQQIAQDEQSIRNS